MKQKRFAFVAVVLLVLLVTSAQDVSAMCDGLGDCVVDGNLLMHKSSATEGNVLKEGVLFIHNFGSVNTFIGGGAGNLTMTGSANTVIGDSAFSLNVSGGGNTASGYSALFNNFSGGRQHRHWSWCAL